VLECIGGRSSFELRLPILAPIQKMRVSWPIKIPAARMETTTSLTSGAGALASRHYVAYARLRPIWGAIFRQAMYISAIGLSAASFAAIHSISNGGKANDRN